MLTDVEAKLVAAHFATPDTALQHFYDSGSIQYNLPMEITYWVRYLMDSGPFLFLDKDLFIDKLISLGVYVKKEGVRGPVRSWEKMYSKTEGVQNWVSV